MKKLIFWASAIIMLLATSCQKEEPIIQLESIQLNQTSLTLGVNKQYQLTVQFSPAEATYKDIVWSSSNPSVATVNADGLIITIKEGTATIQVEHKAQNNKDVNLSATCALMVKESTPDDPNSPDNPGGSTDSSDPHNPGEITPETSLVEGLAFVNQYYSIVQYDTINLQNELKVFPEEIASKVTIKYQTSDNSIATINAKGELVGLAYGEVVVIASANGYQAQCNVLVADFIVPQSLSLNYTEYKLMADETLQLSASFTPNFPTNSSLEWSSSDVEVATVNESGLVTTHKSGNAVITATHKAVNAFDKEVSASCSLEVITYNDLLDMVYIKGGSFQMGATAEQGSDFGPFPVHTVSLSDFYLSNTEVTQAQYQAIMGTNPSQFKGDKLPVETVTWDDAKAFCEKLSQLTGKQYVLPTEAQWEYAARGGVYKQNTKYAGSNKESDVAWAGEDWDAGTTHPVSTKSSNALGLYDMSGNVHEWCADWYGDYSSESQIDPIGPAKGSSHVIRGGSYTDVHFKVSGRASCSPDVAAKTIGFRVAMIP